MQIQFTAEQARALKLAASERETSVAALTREAVDAFFRDRDGLTPAERRERFLSTLGSFRGNGEDVARNHDDYLAEAYGDWVERPLR